MEVLFLYAVALLESGAVFGYLGKGDYRSAFIWICYAAATVALAGGKFK